VRRGEPLFLEEDTNGLLALQAEEDGTCSDCGQPVDESMDPRNESAYTATLVACFACAEAEKAKRDLREQDSDPGIRIGVTKTK
jgi:hypothetical protein